MNPSIGVLIVGAGPTGLTAAIELSRRGVPVRIVDAATGPCPGSRGKGIQPRTLEIFDDLDVIDQMLRAGRTDMGIRYYDRGRLLGEIRTDMVSPARPDVPYPNMLWIPQWHVERILAERLAALGSTVEYGTTLVDLQQRDDVVTAELAGPNGPLRIHPQYVIAADGGHSRTRKLLGVTFEGNVLGEECMVLGDVSLDGLDSAAAHFWMDPETGMLMITPFAGTNSWQLLASVKADAQGRLPEPSVTTFQQLVIERTGLPDVQVHDATWLSQRSQTNTRIANAYRVGRVFLAGDAAHVHSPAGAQAMNTGIQDAYNLGWKLAAVLVDAPEPLLDSYQQERLPVIRRILELSSNLHCMFSSVRQATDIFQALSAGVGVDTHQLDIDYRGSALAVNLGREDLPVRAGDRAPDAPVRDVKGNPLRLFDVLRGTHPTVLAFGEGHDELLACLIRRHGSAAQIYRVDNAPTPTTTLPVLIDADQHAAKAYHAEHGTLLLVRPDGYLGLATNRPGPATSQVVNAYLAALGLSSPS